MLDVHPHHEAVHTWRDFFIHIATIVIGLLIAVGLEQTVEYIHHRLQVAETREALQIERRINIIRFAAQTAEFHRVTPLLQNDLAVFLYLRQHPGAPQSQWPAKLSWGGLTFGYNDSAWKTAQEDNVLTYMPHVEVQKHAGLYTRLEAITNLQQTTVIALNDARSFYIVEPDPSRLSPTEVLQEIDLLKRMLTAQYRLANAQRNLVVYYADFTPAPTRHDLDQLLRLPPDENRKASDALLKEENEAESKIAPTDYDATR